MFIAAFICMRQMFTKFILMDDYKKKLGTLAEKIRNEAPQAPLQQVLPVKPLQVSAKLIEVRFNNWIPKDLRKQIKAYGVEHEISQKDITIQALRDFLRNNNNK